MRKKKKQKKSTKAFVRFKHETPHKKQNSPHPHVIPNYGAKAQYTEPEDDFPPHRADETKFIQSLAGTHQYYGRAVDSTILPSLSSLATEQAKPMAKTKAMVMQLLDYLAMQDARRSNNIIQCKRYDSPSPQRCGIRKRKRSTKPRRRTLLPIEQQQLRSKQRRNIDNVNNNQSSHVVSS